MKTKVLPVPANLPVIPENVFIEPKKAVHSCTCNDWYPNMSILNGMIVIQSHMAWGNPKGYLGKPFQYCPWCSKKLKIRK